MASGSDVKKRTAKKPCEEDRGGERGRSGLRRQRPTATTRSTRSSSFSTAAELLDEKRWQDYIDLFAEDGCTGCRPAVARTWERHAAIFAEDKNLMTVRMKRVLPPGRLVAAALWARTTWSATWRRARIRERRRGGPLALHMMELPATMCAISPACTSTI